MPKIDYIIEKFPDRAYNKNEDSNLYKFLSSLAEELDIFITKLEQVRNSNFVDYAYGKDLDKIGSLLKLKRFSGENDLTYRGRLKAKIPSFIGGGTIDAIRQVIQNFLGVTPSIIEHYREGESHPFFHNGVLNGTDYRISDLNLEIRSGTVYLNGKRITLNDTIIAIPSQSSIYIKIDSDGNILQEATPEIDENKILLYKVETSDKIDKVLDERFILNPFEHFITNIATITVQIPYNFSEDRITLEDTKRILRNTRAAGIAVLVRVVGLYNEIFKINDGQLRFDFLVGFSGMGSDSYIGGQENDDE